MHNLKSIHCSPNFKPLAAITYSASKNLNRVVPIVTISIPQSVMVEAGWKYIRGDKAYLAVEVNDARKEFCLTHQGSAYANGYRLRDKVRTVCYYVEILAHEDLKLPIPDAPIVCAHKITGKKICFTLP